MDWDRLNEVIEYWHCEVLRFLLNKAFVLHHLISHLLHQPILLFWVIHNSQGFPRLTVQILHTQQLPCKRTHIQSTSHYTKFITLL